MERISTKIAVLLESWPDGLDLNMASNAYAWRFGQNIRVEEFGQPTMEALLHSLPGHFFRIRNNKIHLVLAPDLQDGGGVKIQKKLHKGNWIRQEDGLWALGSESIYENLENFPIDDGPKLPQIVENEAFSCGNISIIPTNSEQNPGKVDDVESTISAIILANSEGNPDKIDDVESKISDSIFKDDEEEECSEILLKNLKIESCCSEKQISEISDQYLGRNDELPLPSLPGFLKPGTILPAQLLTIENPDLFYIRIINPAVAASDYDCLQSLEDYMHDFYINRENDRKLKYENCEMPTLEGYYVACLLDKKYVRALICRRINVQEYSVYFPDHGVTEIRNFNTFRRLKKDFAQLPVQAIDCRLTGIQPAGKKHSWKRESVQHFTWLTGKMKSPFTPLVIVAHQPQQPITECLEVILIDSSATNKCGNCINILMLDSATAQLEIEGDRGNTMYDLWLENEENVRKRVQQLWRKVESKHENHRL